MFINIIFVFCLIIFCGCNSRNEKPNVIVINVSTNVLINDFTQDSNLSNITKFYNQGNYLKRYYKSSICKKNFELSILTGSHSRISKNEKNHVASKKKIISVVDELKRNNYEISVLGKWEIFNQNSNLIVDTPKQINNNEIYKFISNLEDRINFSPESSDSSLLNIEAAAKFIDEKANNSFFMLLNLDFKNPNSLAYFDLAFGKMLNQLEEQNILNNTIILLSFDYSRKDSFEMDEQNINIPVIISWNHRIKEGRSNNSLVSSIDIMPTLFDLCGIRKSKEISFDGISWRELLLNGLPVDRKALIVKNKHAFTIVTNNWKYINSDQNIMQSTHNNFDELYNLDTDPSEQNNLAKQVRFNSKLIEMKSQLALFK